MVKVCGNKGDLMIFKSAKCRWCKKRDFKDNMSLYDNGRKHPRIWAHEECYNQYYELKLCPTCNGGGKIDINKEIKYGNKT